MVAGANGLCGLPVPSRARRACEFEFENVRVRRRLVAEENVSERMRRKKCVYYPIALLVCTCLSSVVVCDCLISMAVG